MSMENELNQKILELFYEKKIPMTLDEIFGYLSDSDMSVDEVRFQMDRMVSQKLLTLKSISTSASGSSSSSDSMLIYFPTINEDKRMSSQRAQAFSTLNQYLQEEIANDQEADEQLKGHMDRLHRYNEIKDSAQTLLGVLANIKGVCVRDLYSEFSLDMND